MDINNNNNNNNKIKVLVAFAMPKNQKIIELEVEQSATVAEIIVLSKISDFFPEFDFSSPKAGIFNRAVKLNATCRDGDRIEVYRPLIADPKSARLTRANRAKEEGRANKVTGGRVNSSAKDS